MRYEEIMDIFYLLAAKQTEACRYDGWVIGRAIYKCTETSGADRPLRLVEKRCAAYAVLVSDGVRSGYRYSLELRLLKPVSRSSEESDAGYAVSDDMGTAAVHRCFTIEQIITFADRVHDTNSIHRSDNPVVPGLLLLEWIMDEYHICVKDGFGVTIRFRTPVLAGDDVMLYKSNTETGVEYIGVTADKEKYIGAFQAEIEF